MTSRTHTRIPVRVAATAVALLLAMLTGFLVARAEVPVPDVRAANLGAVQPVVELSPADRAMVADIDAMMQQVYLDKALVAAVDAQLIPAQISADRIALIDAAIASYVVPAGDTVWDRLADCESGNWDRNRRPIPGTARWDYGLTFSHGDIFEGGVNFHPKTWDAYKDAWMPSHAGEASREDQIRIARRVLEDQGWRAWPVCSRKLGLR